MTPQELLLNKVNNLDYQAQQVFFLFVATKEKLQSLSDSVADDYCKSLTKVLSPNGSTSSHLSDTEIGEYYYRMSFISTGEVDKVVRTLKDSGAKSSDSMSREVYDRIMSKLTHDVIAPDNFMLPDVRPFKPDVPTDDDFNRLGREHIICGQVNTSTHAPNNIPEYLKNQKRWVNWRALAVRGKDGVKITKPPVCGGTGEFASLNKPDTFGTFDDVLSTLNTQPNKYSGITFMLDKDCDDTVGIDIDHCIKYADDGTYTLSPFALHFIGAFYMTYIEVSPSGTGIRAFTKGKLPPKDRRKSKVSLSETGFENQVIEWYDKTSPKALTMTGNRLDLSTDGDVVKLPYPLWWLYYSFFRTPDTQKSYSQGSYTQKDSQGYSQNSQPFTDDDIIGIISKAKNSAKFNSLYNGGNAGFGDTSSADTSFCFMLAFYTQSQRGGGESQIDSIFRKSGRMRKKWDERHSTDGGTYGSNLIKFVTSRLSSTYKCNR